MEFNENIVDGLIEISKLKGALGYKDLRSIQAWCRNNNIKIIVLGKKNYITKDSWECFLQRSLNHNGESNLADQNRELAGNFSEHKSKGGSFTSSNGNSAVRDLVTKYKSQLNG